MRRQGQLHFGHIGFKFGVRVGDVPYRAIQDGVPAEQTLAVRRGDLLEKLLPCMSCMQARAVRQLEAHFKIGISRYCSGAPLRVVHRVKVLADDYM